MPAYPGPPPCRYEPPPARTIIVYPELSEQWEKHLRLLRVNREWQDTPTPGTIDSHSMRSYTVIEGAKFTDAQIAALNKAMPYIEFRDIEQHRAEEEAIQAVQESRIDDIKCS